MSRVAKKPISIPAGVDVTVDGQLVTVKGPKGQLQHNLHEFVALSQGENNDLVVETKSKEKTAWAQAGTARAVVNNLVVGVSTGFEKKLTLIGVGYRAQAKGKTLGLSLGFSHPVDYEAPEGITIETPSQTEIVVKGMDKHLVGQVAANIRAYRPPEPYKGKGVRYTDEYVARKEAKKK